VKSGDLSFEWGTPGKENLNIESLTAKLSFSPALATQFLNYLAANGHAEVISDTRICVVNGRTATLDSTTQIPYVIRNQIDGFPADKPQTDVPRAVDGDGIIKEFAEGIRIEIAPTIGMDSIEFDVTASVASHLGYTPNQSVPIIATSTVTSALDIEIGKPACVSGLVRTVHVNERAGIPVLKDLPWVGLLFSREVERTKRSNLCICVTPTRQSAPPAKSYVPSQQPTWPEGQSPPGEPWPSGKPAGK
jgi:type II secretory pathway component GspD/PulD (secretin)